MDKNTVGEMGKQTCSKCRESKDMDCFDKNPTRKSGRAHYCKQCFKTVNKKRKTYEKVRIYYTEAKLDPKKMDKLKARGAVLRAIKSGVIKKSACEAQKCDVIDGTQAHHWLGYSKENWLNVAWLCPKHHADAHYEYNHSLQRNGQPE